MGAWMGACMVHWNGASVPMHGALRLRAVHMHAVYGRLAHLRRALGGELVHAVVRGELLRDRRSTARAAQLRSAVVPPLGQHALVFAGCLLSS